ncbi:hypothetical protein LSCM1_04695 [Leishmania martiniquensis]|uniref:Uncharacterized protein n=1 Tax=Leishmania martiniquensis TaxID=1580590 RepID=A0A836H4M7_9TRYP|nr:hypothetical protein LSCM1_04695 [Leishmania martiniquensis]
MASSTESPLRMLLGSLEKKYPQYHSQLSQAQKLAEQASQMLDSASPYFIEATHYVSVAKEQATRLKLDELSPMLLGLALCFFGGAYTMLIAVVETVRLLCWEDLKNAFHVLQHNYELAVEQNRKDSCIGADGNDVPNVQDCSHPELLSRRASVLLKSLDIDAVQTACRTICTAFMSVIAALRVRLARSLALGGSLASMAMRYVPLEETLKDLLPAEQKKWAGVLAKIAANTIAMTLAAILSGAIGMVHCCIRGAHMFVQHAVHIGKDHGLLEGDMTLGSPKAKALVAVVASVGFLWQVTHTKAYPFPINFFLLPFTVTEYVLSFAVNGFFFAAP